MGYHQLHQPPHHFTGMDLSFKRRFNHTDGIREAKILFRFSIDLLFENRMKPGVDLVYPREAPVHQPLIFFPEDFKAAPLPVIHHVISQQRSQLRYPLVSSLHQPVNFFFRICLQVPDYLRKCTKTGETRIFSAGSFGQHSFFKNQDLCFGMPLPEMICRT
ncbi:hypothetical protein D9M69_562840 [compost metagenome]